MFYGSVPIHLKQIFDWIQVEGRLLCPGSICFLIREVIFDFERSSLYGKDEYNKEAISARVEFVVKGDKAFL